MSLVPPTYTVKSCMTFNLLLVIKTGFCTRCMTIKTLKTTMCFMLDSSKNIFGQVSKRTIFNHHWFHFSLHYSLSVPSSDQIGQSKIHTDDLAIMILASTTYTYNLSNTIVAMSLWGWKYALLWVCVGCMGVIKQCLHSSSMERVTCGWWGGSKAACFTAYQITDGAHKGESHLYQPDKNTYLIAVIVDGCGD